MPVLCKVTLENSLFADEDLYYLGAVPRLGETVVAGDRYCEVIYILYLTSTTKDDESPLVRLTLRPLAPHP